MRVKKGKTKKEKGKSYMVSVHKGGGESGRGGEKKTLFRSAAKAGWDGEPY